MLTKNAVGNLINKYKAVLGHCRLLNVLGACALAATLAMPATALATDVTASQYISSTETQWTSSGNITITNATNTTFGVHTSTDSTSVNINLKKEHSINVTGNGVNLQLSGIFVDRNARNEVTNNGEINVSVTGSSSHAYGVGVQAGTGTGIINNFGSINVSSSGGLAFQACAMYSQVYIDTWTFKLGETYGSTSGKGFYYVFGVKNDGHMQFGTAVNSGAKFIISGLGDAFVSGTEYAVKEMVLIAGLGSRVSGSIAEVTSAYDFLTVELIDTDPANPLWSNQSIKGTLSATKDNSPAQAAANQTVSGMTANLNQLRNIVSNQTRKVGEGLDFGKMKVVGEASSTMYADAGTTLTDASYMPDAPLWKVFAMPYYCQSGANNNDYDGHMYGIAMGATRSVTDAFSLGVHAGFSKGSGDSDMTDSDATAYTLGLHAVYNVNESLFFRGQLSGFLAESELDMLGAADGSTRANADMDATGLYAMVAAGYDILLDAQNVLTPELGISYFYSHMDGFDTHFRDRSGVDQDAFGMKGDSYDVWYADAILRWTGAYDISTGTLKPTLKAGVRQALTDPEVASTMTFGTATATTYADANQTAFICEAGLAWEIDDMTLSATYSGEFGDVEYSHMGMLKLEWAF